MCGVSQRAALSLPKLFVPNLPPTPTIKRPRIQLSSEPSRWLKRRHMSQDFAARHQYHTSLWVKEFITQQISGKCLPFAKHQERSPAVFKDLHCSTQYVLRSRILVPRLPSPHFPSLSTMQSWWKSSNCQQFSSWGQTSNEEQLHLDLSPCLSLSSWNLSLSLQSSDHCNQHFCGMNSHSWGYTLSSKNLNLGMTADQEAPLVYFNILTLLRYWAKNDSQY